MLMVSNTTKGLAKIWGKFKKALVSIVSGTKWEV